MSGAMILYLLTISLLLVLAAAVAEWLLVRLGRPTRWVWSQVMLLCVVLPLLPVRPTAEVSLEPVAITAALALPAGGEPARESVVAAALDFSVDRTWLVLASGVTGSLLLIGWALLANRSRRWPEATLDGTTVLRAPATGPAVVGFFRPRIVVPEWAFELPPEQRRMLLAHEQHHIDARDPLLLLGSALVVVAMPWNPLLWLALHRLRAAIEVDCDRRVLAGGEDADSYARCLIDSVALSAGGAIPAVGSLSLSSTHLERRVALMLHPHRARRLTALVVVLLAAGLVTSAFRATPPVAAQPASHEAIEVERVRLREERARGLFYERLTAGKVTPGAMYNIFHDNWQIRDPKAAGC